MAAIAVSAEGLGKRYRVIHQREPYGRLTETLWAALLHPLDRMRGRVRPGPDDFWALRDASFEVAQGEVLGIVGRNGAGKTTLLRILSRITEPTEGRAELRGRVASLLEVGTGFHPELSGRENIFLSGSILGMRRQEIERRFDEIVAFAEVDAFLDMPVKRYSSGMSVRLGFAVAAHLETEILIVDEVLAVGDAAFQRKCLARMEDVSRAGRTILFVSHNMPAVESLCGSGLMLERGAVAARGTAREVVDRYLALNARAGSIDMTARSDRRGDGRMRFTGLDASLRTGRDSSIELAFETRPGVRNVEVAVGLFTTRGEGAAHLATASTGTSLETLPASGRLVCHLPDMPLLPGHYSVNLFCTVNGSIADWLTDAAVVEVAEGDFFGSGRLPPPSYGSVAVAHRWELRDE